METAHSPLAHLFRGTARDALQQIIMEYTTRGSLVVSFLYFAQIMQNNLLEGEQTPTQKDYTQALVASDFLFADGIALQMFYRWSSLGRKDHSWLHNLNGTDFIPQLLPRLFAAFPQMHVAVYASFDSMIGKDATRMTAAEKQFSQQYGREIDFARQNDYRKSDIDAFPREEYTASSASFPQRLLIVCKGSPHQEVRAQRNRERLQALGVLVINAGGWIDYLSGFERRAPRWVVKARVLETFWRVTMHPKKNAKKLAVMFGIFGYWYRIIIAWVRQKFFPNHQ